MSKQVQHQNLQKWWSSIGHYIIELINFIFLNQDRSDHIAVLAGVVDFEKAFNRIDHNLFITKLFDMDVSGWLLKVVMGFLTNRRMVIRYSGKLSSIKQLPRRVPQGTLLELFLFLVLMKLGLMGKSTMKGGFN